MMPGAGEDFVDLRMNERVTEHEVAVLNANVL